VLPNGQTSNQQDLTAYTATALQHTWKIPLSRQLLKMGTRWPETFWANYKGEINILLKWHLVGLLIHIELRCTVNHTSKLYSKTDCTVSLMCMQTTWAALVTSATCILLAVTPAFSSINEGHVLSCCCQLLALYTNPEYVQTQGSSSNCHPDRLW